MKIGLLTFIALFSALSFAADINPTKPTPGKDIETILSTLDCAGTVDGQAVRLKPGQVDEAKGEFEILAVTTHPTFHKSFSVVGFHTGREQYAIHGNQPEAFMLLIDKFGVHGAHNASLEFPMSPGERYSFECYFY